MNHQIQHQDQEQKAIQLQVLLQKEQVTEPQRVEVIAVQAVLRRELLE